MNSVHIKATEAAEAIRKRVGGQPRLGVILGTGFGEFASRLSNARALPYSSIPHFPMPAVKGHSGTLTVGEFAGATVAVLQGRVHHYEGYFMRDITFPVRTLAELGVKTVIITNAAGGVREDLEPGEFMAVSDHINLMGVNPLMGLGPDDEGRDRFLDLVGAYDETLLSLCESAAASCGIGLKKGVLAAMPGPSYETPAEVRMLRLLGADAVCMSTVPEVVMARYLGLRVLAISLITNKGAGMSANGPNHYEVLDAAYKSEGAFAGLMEGVVRAVSKAGLTGI